MRSLKLSPEQWDTLKNRSNWVSEEDEDSAIMAEIYEEMHLADVREGVAEKPGPCPWVMPDRYLGVVMKEVIQALIKNLTLEANHLATLGRPTDWSSDQHLKANARLSEKREVIVRLEEILRNWA